MRKDIRTKSLNQSQKEKKAEVKKMIFQVLVFAMIISLINIGAGFISEPLDVAQILLGATMIIITGFFIIRINSANENISEIENQIKSINKSD